MNSKPHYRMHVERIGSSELNLPLVYSMSQKSRLPNHRWRTSSYVEGSARGAMEDAAGECWAHGEFYRAI